MKDIEQKAMKTYQDNLSFFKKNYPELYAKITLFETALSEKQYQERYLLEYKNEGYFDVQEISTGNWLYNENSIEYSRNLTNLIDTQKSGGVFEAQRFVDFSPNMPDIIDKSELHFHNALWAYIKIVEYVKNNVPKATTSMKQAYKIIFLGTGLGVHIPLIIQKLGSKVVFIKEKDIELFRLSLFVTNYSKLSKNATLFFSIMDDEVKRKIIFQNFLENGNNYNLYLKYIPFFSQYQEDLDEFQRFTLTQEHIYYPYSAYLLRYIESPRYVAKGLPFLNVEKRSYHPFFASKPILLLFSGPSTAKNLTWLKQNKDRFIIISALSTCKLLYMNDITPDIVMHIDPAKDDALILLEGIDSSFFKETIFIFSSNIHEELFAKFPTNHKYFIQQGAAYKKDYGFFGAPSVGEFTYGIALIFGAQKLYLLGIDLALDPETLESHSEYHPYIEKGDSSATQVDKMMTFVKGNFLPTVPTLNTFKMSIDEFKRFSNALKEVTQEVYNLSNGAYLEATNPLHSEDIDLTVYPIIDRKLKQEELIAFFNSISSAEFREEDKAILRYQIIEANKLVTIIEKHKARVFIMPTLYLDALANLSWNLSDMENKTKSDLAEVYYYYFKTVLSYIFDLFNTKELDNLSQHIKAIDAILVTQLEKIANTYISTMEKYLQEE